MAESSPSHFPSTAQTWLDKRLSDGERGRREIQRHVMELYSWPLQAFCRALPRGRQQNPTEAVHGFFASRLGRPDYFVQWRASGKRLRNWLMNGLAFYLQEQTRHESRFSRVGTLPEDLNSTGHSPEAAFHRAFLVTLARIAMDRACVRCRSEGLEPHWRVFTMRRYDDLSYAAIQRKTGIEPARAAVMVRTAARRMREELIALLAADGIPRERIPAALREVLG